jgi:hypothetical protein
MAEIYLVVSGWRRPTLFPRIRATELTIKRKKEEKEGKSEGRRLQGKSAQKNGGSFPSFF